MNLPSRTRSPFEGQLARQLERTPITVERIRAPRRMNGVMQPENRQRYTATKVFVDDDGPRRYEGWGRDNIQNPNVQQLLFEPVVDIVEGDQLRFDDFFWRVSNVNREGHIGGLLGFLIVALREAPVRST